MAQLQRKKKFAFAIASMFDGNQCITWFDADGHPIRKKKKKQQKKDSFTSQTSLL